MADTITFVGQLIAVEGLDGAGKNTLVTALVQHWRDDGLRVATMTFPRYGESVHADLAAEALRGGHGDVADSVNAMALLFALDRADAAPTIRTALTENDIVLLDRYVASNAAYSAGRAGQDADGELIRWVADLEFGRFGMPVPDRHLLLGVPVDVAIGRAASRAAADARRQPDRYERDLTLQQRVDAVYHALAQSNWMSPWISDDGSEPISLARTLSSP